MESVPSSAMSANSLISKLPNHLSQMCQISDVVKGRWGGQTQPHQCEWATSVGVSELAAAGQGEHQILISLGHALTHAEAIENDSRRMNSSTSRGAILIARVARNE
jgi:hypothetical protein